MKKQRNCWFYGFTRSVVILALVLVPALIIKGVPDPKAYAATVVAILAVGTLIFGGIERYYRRSLNKTDA